MMTGKIVVLVLVILLLGSGIFVVSKITLPNPQVSLPNFSFPKLFSFNNSQKTNQPIILPESLLLTPSPLPTITPFKTPASQPTPTIMVQQPQLPAKSICYQATISHLDGSTSNRCYSVSDSEQILTLQQQLTIEQGRLDFWNNNIEGLKKSYEQYKSQIYLDSIKNFEKLAEDQKVKIAQIHLQLYNIEQRGY